MFFQAGFPFFIDDLEEMADIPFNGSDCKTVNAVGLYYMFFYLEYYVTIRRFDAGPKYKWPLFFKTLKISDNTPSGSSVYSKEL